MKCKSVIYDGTDQKQQSVDSKTPTRGRVRNGYRNDNTQRTTNNNRVTKTIVAG